jgi:transcriptional regulator with XRE-family HTH domain
MEVQTGQIAEEVRAALARKRVRQRELADFLGLSQPGVSRRLSGDVEFSIHELSRAAELLGMPLADFLPLPPVVESSLTQDSATDEQRPGDAA